MQVDLKDGCCRSCAGQLAVIDADDATMTVECEECGDSYLMEPDAFGDGAIKYWPAAAAKFMEGREDE